MNHDFEQILKNERSLHLSDSEKSDMKSAVLHYMRANPIRGGAQPLPWYLYFRTHIAMTTIVALVFLSGSSSALAELSVPGDLFYPVKTGVNEQVLGLLAVSPQAKAEWQVSLADRRLQEAEHVALNTNVSEEIKSNLIAQVDTHLQNASKESGDDSAEVLTQTASNSDTNHTLEKARIAPVRAAKMMATFAAPVSSTTIEQEGSGSNEGDNIDQVMEKIRRAKEDLSVLKSQKGDARLKIQAEIELVKARRELFRQKDKGNHEAAEDLKTTVNNEIQKVGESEDKSLDSED